MLKKGEWRFCELYCWLITTFLLSIYPVIRVFMRFIDEVLLALIVSLLIIVFFSIVALISIPIGKQISWYVNVERKTADTKIVIQNLPVVAKIGGYYTEGFIAVGSYTKFEVKIELDEGTYYTFNGIENYATVKEGDLAKVEVKLYYDDEGDIFYIEPLKLVGGCDNETTKESISEKSTTTA